MKDGDGTSDKLRLFIDLLYLHYFPTTSDVPFEKPVEGDDSSVPSVTLPATLQQAQKKEAWKKRVEAESKLPVIESDFDYRCKYRAVTSKGEVYCDDKKINKEICETRHNLHRSYCMPPKMMKQRKGKKTFSPNLYQPKSGDKGATRLWRE